MPPAKSVDSAHWRERLRISIWLIIGYAVIAALVLLPILALLWLAVYSFPLLEGAPAALLALFAVFYGVDVIRALHPPPAESGCEDALVLRESDAPGLYALIDSVRICVGGPALHTVVLSNRLNASISQRAPLLWLGKTRHTMEIGLPLLCLLPAGQIGAIIAHEFGHLMGQHGLLGRRIHVLRRCLIGLQENLSESGAATSQYWRWFHRISCSGLLLFLRWYVPRLDARSFAVRCAGEYVADRAAARWDGAQTFVQALYSLEVAECYLHFEFWPRLWDEARHSSTPCGDPFSQLLSGKTMDSLALDQATEWIYHALRATTGNEDTHPSLHDRVIQLGADTRTATVASPIGGVAHLLLSDSFLHDAAAKMDAQWAKAVEPDWKHYRQGWQETVAAHEALRLRATTQRLRAWDWLDMSDKSRRLSDPSWEEELRHAHTLAPDNPDVLYALGVAHQKQGRLEEAAGCLARAIELDKMETLRCSRALTRLSLVRGDLPAAAQHRLRADEAVRHQRAIDAELCAVHEDDELAPHGLPLHRIRQVEQDIQPIAHYAERIWLVKKVSRIDSGFSRYVFVVAAGTQGWRYALDRLLMRGGSRQEICRRLADNLRLDLPTIPLWHFCTPEGVFARRLVQDGIPCLMSSGVYEK